MKEQNKHKKTTFKCCICKKVKEGYGNNPHPYMFHGRCCDDCNKLYVIPMRILLLDQNNEQK